MPMLSLYTPWKHQKTRGFLMLSGGIRSGRLEKTLNVQQIRFQWDLAKWFGLIRGYFIPNFKVWKFGTPSFCTHCFLLFNNRKTFENTAQSAFSIKRMPKIELFQLLSHEYLLMRSCSFINQDPTRRSKKARGGGKLMGNH